MDWLTVYFFIYCGNGASFAFYWNWILGVNYESEKASHLLTIYYFALVINPSAEELITEPSIWNYAYLVVDW